VPSAIVVYLFEPEHTAGFENTDFFSLCGRAKGNTYQAAVRALALKWIRILYRCWQTRTPYNESTYLNALRKRGSPLLKNLDLG
jgi:hypothetical protein